MMLRLCLLLLLALYKVSAQQCPSSGCPSGYYRKNKSSGTYKNGNLSFKCNSASTSKVAAMIGKASRGACKTFMNQVAKHCGCTNSKGESWPKKLTGANCAVPCSPSATSAKGKYTPPATTARLKIPLSCYHCALFAKKGAFSSSQCSIVKSIMSSSCCNRRNLRGDDQEQDYDEELDAESLEKLEFLLLMEEGGERALEQEELLDEQESESI